MARRGRYEVSTSKATVCADTVQAAIVAGQGLQNGHNLAWVSVRDRRTKILMVDRHFDPIALVACCIAIGWLRAIVTEVDTLRRWLTLSPAEHNGLDVAIHMASYLESTAGLRDAEYREFSDQMKSRIQGAFS